MSKLRSPYGPITVDVPATTSRSGGMRLVGSPVSIRLPAPAQAYLYSGWQSWSMTAWVPTDRPVLPLRPRNQQMRVADPAYVQERRPNGSWYGAVRLADGQVVFLGSLGLDTHVALEGDQLKGWSETGQAEWFLCAGQEGAILERYAALLRERLGARPVSGGSRPAPRSPTVWCSWYSLYGEIEEDRLLRVVEELKDLPFDILQVDDGWQRAIGDWEANTKFPSGMAALAGRIRASGRKAGLWLAPLLVVPSSDLYREHPDWLLRDRDGQPVPAGFNWGEPNFALDTTHPAALDWLAGTMKRVRSWGYDYAKLDFLYAGALPGVRHADMPREAAYRHALEIIREALGNAYLLGCGAPVLPSLGLCDGLRIGPDVDSFWASWRDDALLRNFATPGVRNALRTCLHRLWLQPLVQTDPDVVYFRSRQNTLTEAERRLLQDLGTIAGFKATSDLPAWLNEQEMQELTSYLQSSPAVHQTGPYRFEIGGRTCDFSTAVPLPPSPGSLTNLLGAAVSRLAESPAVMRLVDRLFRARVRRALSV